MNEVYIITMNWWQFSLFIICFAVLVAFVYELLPRFFKKILDKLESRNWIENRVEWKNYGNKKPNGKEPVAIFEHFLGCMGEKPIIKKMDFWAKYDIKKGDIIRVIDEEDEIDNYLEVVEVKKMRNGYNKAKVEFVSKYPPASVGFGISFGEIKNANHKKIHNRTKSRRKRA